MTTRLRKLTASAALVLAAGGAGLASAAPASAAGELRPVVSCYTKIDSTTYRVFFGYENGTGSAKTIARGAVNNNAVASGLLNGSLLGDITQSHQPTSFATGSHPAAFSVDAKANLGGILGGLTPATASWTLDDRTPGLFGPVLNRITFSSNNLGTYNECGPSVDLPATGNPAALAGLFAAVALVGGVVVKTRSRRTKKA
jgi:hypothetical protein